MVGIALDRQSFSSFLTFQAFSQYPGEEEYVMQPLSCLEVTPSHLFTLLHA